MSNPVLALVSTGNTGLDLTLAGGLPAKRLYVLEDARASGKTTLALQLRRKGVRRDKRARPGRQHVVQTQSFLRGRRLLAAALFLKPKAASARPFRC